MKVNLLLNQLVLSSSSLDEEIQIIIKFKFKSILGPYACIVVL